MASSQQNLLPPPTTIDDTHKVYSIAIACIVMGIVTSLFVLSRLWVRFHAGAFGADDWAMIPALVSSWYLDRKAPITDLRSSSSTSVGPQWLHM